MAERRNDGMVESQNGGKSRPQFLKDGIAESRNGRKYPQILKEGIAESRNGEKYSSNPKRRNDGKSSEILKDGIM